MRKIAIFGLFVFLILLTTASFGQEASIKVVEISGKVLVRIHPSTEWTDASPGQVLKENDSIKTEEGSMVRIEFPDKSSFSLKPKSQIAIEELVWDNVGRKVGVNMPIGELRAIIKKVDTPSKFKVKTPTAITGTVGTTFYIIVTPTNTSVYVSDGAVDFASLAGEIYTIVSGSMAYTAPDGTVIGPTVATDEYVIIFTSGWDAGLVAEPYVAPEGDVSPAGDLNPPEVNEENVASRI